MKKKFCILWLLLVALFIGAQVRAAQERIAAGTKDAEMSVSEHEVVYHTTAAQVSSAPIQTTSVPAETATPQFPEFTYCRDWNKQDADLLARIAMAEAEGESLQSKEYVILTVLNRVQSVSFPDTIKEVIFEEHNGVYQFSCIGNGRWDRCNEPTPECYEAVENVRNASYDISEGALYFECCTDTDNWHSRNLEYLYTSDNIRFYK